MKEEKQERSKDEKSQEMYNKRMCGVGLRGYYSR